MKVFGVSIKFGTSSKGKPVFINDNSFRYHVQAKTSTWSHWIYKEYRRGPKFPASVVFNEIDRTCYKSVYTHVVDLSKGGCFGKGYIDRKQLRGDYSSVVAKGGVQTDKCE